MLSQKAVINPGSKTVTLDEKKTVDVAKIIKNEERLKKENQALLETIRKQDSIIQSLANETIAGLEEVERLNDDIDGLSDEVERLSDLQLEYEEKRKKLPKVFGKLQTNYFQDTGMIMPAVGLNYQRGKFGIGAQAGVHEKQFFYGAELLISIF